VFGNDDDESVRGAEEEFEGAVTVVTVLDDDGSAGSHTIKALHLGNGHASARASLSLCASTNADRTKKRS